MVPFDTVLGKQPCGAVETNAAGKLGADFQLCQAVKTHVNH